MTPGRGPRDAAAVLRAVVDTNVLVSAMLRRGSVPAQVLELAIASRFTWLVDGRIITEYRDVLARPAFAFDGAAVSDLLAVVEAHAEWVVASPLSLRIADAGDLPFVEVAVAGGADAIVTGNVADYRLSSGGRLALDILTPRAFLGLMARR